MTDPTATDPTGTDPTATDPTTTDGPDGNADSERRGAGTPEIASFMLRFTQERWRDARGEPRVRWRGHIRHVQGDRQLRFTEFADAVAFMQRQLAELTAGAVAEDSEPERRKAMADSFRLWERFATGYTDMMMDAMEATARRSGDYQRQVGDAVARTLDALNPLSGTSRKRDDERPPGSSVEAASPEDLRRSVEELRDDIRRLSEKIDRLDATDRR